MASTIGFASTPFDDHPLWPLRAPAYWVAIPLVALAYASVAAISLLLAIPPGYASAVWPPAGIALAAWLAFGPRIWPGILIGAALANLGVAGTTPAVALAIGLGNSAEAAVAGLLLRRFLALRHRFERPAAVWAFAAIAFGAATVAATSGVVTLALAGQVRWADFGTHWLTWWLGDATGIVIVAPLLLAWSEPGTGLAAGERRIEVQLFAALLALCAALLWAIRFPADTVQKLAYLMIPLVTWAAARLDQRAVTAASFAISAVAIMDMLDGVASMFVPMPLNESLLMLQLFVSLVALVGLTLSSLAGEVVRVNTHLEASRAELQRLVTERTVQLDQTLAHQVLLARRMVKIRDEERKRLAAELHGSVARDVTSLREVISRLHPPSLEGVALASALRRYAAEFEERTGILVSVQSPPSRDTLPLNMKDGLLRISLEAMNNAAKHADATSIRIDLSTDASATQLVVQDDGRGFDLGAARPQNGQSGAGLLIMRERAIAIGGQLRLLSAPGAGTTIACTVPRGREVCASGPQR